jgi:YggT family protein
MVLVHEILGLYIWVLIISALLSWFPTTNQNGGLASTKRVLARLTEPVLRPIRQIMPRPRIGGVGIDFSVLIAVVVLEVINAVI